MEQVKQLTRNPDDRAVLRGDTAAMLSLAGYAVHPDGKPGFPACTPPLPAAPGREAWRGLYQNYSDIRYPDEPDEAVYTRHLTAVNCYYDACSVKELLYDRGKDGAGVRYSRACGVLSPGNEGCKTCCFRGRFFAAICRKQTMGRCSLGTILQRCCTFWNTIWPDTAPDLRSMSKIEGGKGTKHCRAGSENG